MIRSDLQTVRRIPYSKIVASLASTSSTIASGTLSSFLPFQVPWAFLESPPSYRVDSRLLKMNICEEEDIFHAEGQLSYQPCKCGEHYFVMTDQGLKLVYKALQN